MTIPSIADVQFAVARFYGLTITDLKSEDRHRCVSNPRMLAMMLARDWCGRTLPEIGERFGGRDHTTVLSGIRRTKYRLTTGSLHQDTIDAIHADVFDHGNQWKERWRVEMTAAAAIGGALNGMGHIFVKLPVRKYPLTPSHLAA